MEANKPGKGKTRNSDAPESIEKSTVKYVKVPERQVAYIIFDRQEVLNAMTFADERFIREMVAEAERDEEVKVLIFKGEGPCFGTGGHVATLGPNIGFGKSGAERRPSQRARILNDKNSGWGFNGSHQAVLRCAKPTIAQVHGYCYGAHFHTALSCDFIVAAQNAVFGHPGYRYIGPMYTQVLCILTMGLRKSKDMMLTGKTISAQEALDCGLVNNVVPLEKLESEVNSLSEELTLMPFDALVMGKSAFEIALDVMGVGTGLTIGSTLHAYQTNIRYEPGEYNLFKSRKDKGINKAIKEREEHFKKSRLSTNTDET